MMADGFPGSTGGSAVLLLQLAGPMQSWGISSKFETRDTAVMPSKSGVCGLLAAALGRPRNADVSDLAALRFGVRADRSGQVLDDFQMARSMDFPAGQMALHRKLYGVPSKEHASLIHKHYLMDAVFLAGFEGDAGFLAQLHEALQYPMFPLYLGRRCCPPARPVPIGLRDGKLLDVLRDEPHLCEWPRSGALYQMDSMDGHGMLLRDVPVSYDPCGRKYGYRRVVEGIFSDVVAPEHDPMAELSHDPMAGLDVERKGVMSNVPVQDMA